MNDVSELLARHLPLLRYDSGERFFTVAVEAWSDSPGNELRRADGTVLAAAEPAPGQAQLSLAFLGPERYADGTPAHRDDRVAGPRGDGRARARQLQTNPHFANRVYGHATTGKDGRVWLSYWFFYLYNDYTLFGPLLGAGRHDGDWEMIQLRLDPAGQVPDLALYTQHQDVEARRWEQIVRVGERPVICVARGCHACYYSPGLYWTGVWFDRADGRGPAPALDLEILGDENPGSAWVRWPGRWGGTTPGSGIGQRYGLDQSSPRGPGHQRQWRDPANLMGWIKPRRPPRLPCAR